MSHYGSAGRSYRFTKHAEIRANARRLSRRAVAAALEFGRRVYTRGAMICVKVVEHYESLHEPIEPPDPIDADTKTRKTSKCDTGWVSAPVTQAEGRDVTARGRTSRRVSP